MAATLGRRSLGRILRPPSYTLCVVLISLTLEGVLVTTALGSAVPPRPAVAPVAPVFTTSTESRHPAISDMRRSVLLQLSAGRDGGADDGAAAVSATTENALPSNPVAGETGIIPSGLYPTSAGDEGFTNKTMEDYDQPTDDSSGSGQDSPSSKGINLTTMVFAVFGYSFAYDGAAWKTVENVAIWPRLALFAVGMLLLIEAGTDFSSMAYGDKDGLGKPIGHMKELLMDDIHTEPAGQLSIQSVVSSWETLATRAFWCFIYAFSCLVVFIWMFAESSSGPRRAGSKEADAKEDRTISDKIEDEIDAEAGLKPCEDDKVSNENVAEEGGQRNVCRRVVASQGCKLNSRDEKTGQVIDASSDERVDDDSEMIRLPSGLCVTENALRNFKNWQDVDEGKRSLPGRCADVTYSAGGGGGQQLVGGVSEASTKDLNSTPRELEGIFVAGADASALRTTGEDARVGITNASKATANAATTADDAGQMGQIIAPTTGEQFETPSNQMIEMRGNVVMDSGIDAGNTIVKDPGVRRDPGKIQDNASDVFQSNLDEPFNAMAETEPAELTKDVQEMDGSGRRRGGIDGVPVADLNKDVGAEGLSLSRIDEKDTEKDTTSTEDQREESEKSETHVDAMGGMGRDAKNTEDGGGVEGGLPWYDPEAEADLDS